MEQDVTDLTVAIDGQRDASIDGTNLLAFPGLFNAHDHLDFNLFPMLGSKYKHYLEWGPDIHRNHGDTIRQILEVPYVLRVKWGMIKNILNGFTRVIDHSAKPVPFKFDYIDIYNDFQYLHSIALTKHWRLKLNNPLNRLPAMIHIGEGVNSDAHKEIDKLLHWNILKKELIGIHAIAMDSHQAEKFKAIVWCPASNEFLYGKTADVDKLKDATSILFGTDSTISSSANFWQHLRQARHVQRMSDQEIFSAITHTPERTFQLPATRDVVVARKKYRQPWDAFYAIDPVDIVLVTHHDKPIYYDPEVIDWPMGEEFGSIKINGVRKCLIRDLVMVIAALENMNVKMPMPINACHD